jgi:uncharacterized membrane protein YecN with MAPEG domain
MQHELRGSKHSSSFGVVGAEIVPCMLLNFTLLSMSAASWIALIWAVPHTVNRLLKASSFSKTTAKCSRVCELVKQ